MLRVLPASGSAELLGGSPVGHSPVHIDRLRVYEPAELDAAGDTRHDAAFSALAGSICSACMPNQLSQRLASIPHVSQAAAWDCGLACAAMCLGACQLDAPSLAALQALHPNQSVWTVDLAHLLRRFGLHVHYFTLTVGINPGFLSESYYDDMELDVFRIQQLFEEAEGQGIVISQRSVSDAEIEQFLDEASHLIIALLDKNQLDLGVWIWNEGQTSAFDVAATESYTGHYVVVCGYDRASDHYIIRDPDPRMAAMGFSYISRSLFNTARRAFGTDEDLLFVAPQ